MEYITPDEFNVNIFREIPILKRKKGNQKTNDRTKYLDVLCAFDIETTRLTANDHPAFAGTMKKKNGVLVDSGDGEQAVMYMWQLHIHHHVSVIGRTWDELGKLLTKIDRLLTLQDNDSRVVLWVHNLSYEFQFLRAIWDYQTDDVFAIESRKVLKATIFNRFELRCSYLHSNMSLAEYAKKMGATHQKLSGEQFDYGKKRFPWTPLSDYENEYALSDVVGLCESLEIEMQVDGDNLYTIPLTSTGYVRRDARKAMSKISRSWLPSILPEPEIFEMLHEAFGGGNTHANRYYVGHVLHNVKSADRSSSYPDEQCNRDFPMGKFFQAGKVDFDELIHLMTVRKKAMVMRIAFTNIRQRDIYYGCPYINRHKCRRLENGAFDNGRVLSADYLETTVTDIDLRIILEQYDADIIDPYDVAYTRYAPLPEELKEVARTYYRGKTELKNVEGMDIYYMKNKAKLNAIYGMSAQNPAKQSVEYRHGEFVETESTIPELLEESYKRAFMTYAWGVWTTAWARWDLERGIRLAGDGFVYCDTDSVKYLGDVDWTDYNNSCIANSTKNRAYATDPDGVTHYMGVYEMEKTYADFATLGAKKYAYRYEKGGETFVTIAGVTKSKGGHELDKGDEYGTGVERFADYKHPFTFVSAGGTESLYQDRPKIGSVTIDGHDLKITPNIVIRDSTYTLGITDEYEMLIDGCELPEMTWLSCIEN